MQRSIRTNIQYLILIPIAALGLTAIATFAVLSRRDVAERTRLDMPLAASSLSSFLGERTQHLQMETKLLAEVPYIRAATEADDFAGAQAQVDRYYRFLNGDGMLLVDGREEMIAKDGPIKQLGPESLKAMGVEKALDGAPWSGLVQTPAGLTLAATAPLKVGQYSKGAAICYSVVNDDMARALGRQLNLQVAFVASGKVVASSDPMPALKVSERGPVFAQIQGRQFAGDYLPLPQVDGAAGFIAFRPVDDIIGPSRSFLYAFLAILIPAFILAGLISNRFARNMLQPLDGVVQAAAELGQGVWPEPFSVARKDEIGILQSAFNGMTRALQENERKLKAMIDLDPLTGQANHRRFKQAAAEEMAICASSHKPLAIVLFDLDRFSEFNKRHGFSAGDELLRRCGDLVALSAISVETVEKPRRMPSDSTRPGITPVQTSNALTARYGGEEFAVLLSNCTIGAARAFAERVCAEFAEQESGMTLSAGCAAMEAGTSQAESLCLAAELAVAQAKQLGRNQVCDFNEGADPFELSRFLQDGTIATIQALAAAVDAKDSYTKGHSQRVAEYAADLCRFLGGSDQEVELVFRTGTLHDVGKIGVPDEILKKPGPLTPDERAVMETHPALGEIIVRKVPQLQDTLPGVRHHHERWDGKGYPDGLAGLDIPRLGRILAVADTFDAMTSDRPYRKGMPREVALTEIAKNAGIQFDSEMAAAFVKMLECDESSKRAA